MENPLGKEWKELIASPDGAVLAKAVDYCKKMIALKEEGKLSEEEAGYWICSLVADDRVLKSEISDIVDCGCDLEIPRETRYKTSLNLPWDKKTADAIKKEEWDALLEAVDRAEQTIKKREYGI